MPKPKRTETKNYPMDSSENEKLSQYQLSPTKKIQNSPQKNQSTLIYEKPQEPKKNQSQTLLDLQFKKLENARTNEEKTQAVKNIVSLSQSSKKENERELGMRLTRRLTECDNRGQLTKQKVASILELTENVKVTDSNIKFQLQKFKSTIRLEEYKYHCNKAMIFMAIVVFTFALHLVFLYFNKEPSTQLVIIYSLVIVIVGVVFGLYFAFDIILVSYYFHQLRQKDLSRARAGWH